MADTDEKAEAAETSRRKGGAGVAPMLAKACGTFVLVLGAVLVGGYLDEMLRPSPQFEMKDGALVLKEPPKGERGKAGAAGPAQPAIYVSFDPPLIVNFDDPEAVRFLQVQIDVLTREPSVVEAVNLHQPAIRNNLLMRMNGRDYRELMTREGKEALRVELLKEVQQLLERETGVPGVEDLFFTSFVVQ